MRTIQERNNLKTECSEGDQRVESGLRVSVAQEEANYARAHEAGQECGMDSGELGQREGGCAAHVRGRILGGGERRRSEVDGERTKTEAGERPQREASDGGAGVCAVSGQGVDGKQGEVGAGAGVAAQVQVAEALERGVDGLACCAHHLQEERAHVRTQSHVAHRAGHRLSGAALVSRQARSLKRHSKFVHFAASELGKVAFFCRLVEAARAAPFC
mmetsp:Transcript_6931/g.21124  ORF Transcript_6931/g.21124 Transcript_6931/m.21124 type:complete len:216 (+) Transcript_6931:1213-1860(+)